ncbi:MAG: 4-hydroxy-tetrahydrodipicolinate reductase [Candidatus Curtissbacteria bacterium]|nr:4-hydroxy-tetrahydrodipicolinate reductase [Candidatus Curtissbacteria bacterium]
MKIALVGYGNMGQELEKLLDEVSGHKIVSISFKSKTDRLDKEGIKRADVAVDFTSGEIVLSNIKEILALGTKIVVGTTGWYDNFAAVKGLVEKSKGGLIYAKNFSVGANIFFKIVSYSSKLFDKYGGYDVYGLEMHHSGKKDSPSGTARKITDLVIANFGKKKVANFEKLDRQIKEEELHFASVRGGNNFGFHEVVFDSAADEVKLSHQAHSRRGFAQGALLAAEFIKNKKGIYSFEQVFDKEKI